MKEVLIFAFQVFYFILVYSGRELVHHPKTATIKTKRGHTHIYM